jgi:hypothetical protein
MSNTSRGSLRAQAPVAATGGLVEPKYPDIRGLADFQGACVHSARWNHDHNLRGERVGLIGTGASAAQFIPKVHKQVARLTIFQRTPGWVIPRLDHPHSASKMPARLGFGLGVGSGCLGEWLEGDLVAEAFELVDEASAVAFGVLGVLGVLGVSAVEELFAELVVGDSLVQDVVGGGEDLVAGRDGGFGVSAATFDAVIARGEVVAFGAHDRFGAFGQGAA